MTKNLFKSQFIIVSVNIYFNLFPIKCWSSKVTIDLYQDFINQLLMPPVDGDE